MRKWFAKLAQLVTFSLLLSTAPNSVSIKYKPNRPDRTSNYLSNDPRTTLYVSCTRRNFLKTGECFRFSKTSNEYKNIFCFLGTHKQNSLEYVSDFGRLLFKIIPQNSTNEVLDLSILSRHTYYFCMQRPHRYNNIGQGWTKSMLMFRIKLHKSIECSHGCINILIKRLYTKTEH